MWTFDHLEASTAQKLVLVDRAISELRRGSKIVVKDGNQSLLMLASEALGAEQLSEFQRFIPGPVMVAITGQRAKALGWDEDVTQAYLVHSQEMLLAPMVEFLCDPVSLSKEVDLTKLKLTPASPLEKTCLQLAKLSRLLPSALIGPLTQPCDDLTVVNANDIEMYQIQAARSLRMVSQTRLPLNDAENTKLLAFRPFDGGHEHFAIVVGEPNTTEPVLIRLHSECFTGDILGSMRCDCGSQLRDAIAAIEAVGSGVLLYLAQEGRGIGLVNKIRAYQLQDAGFDTVDANLQLGFDEDERIYLPAAQMLKLMGITKVKLMTNNPAKLQSLMDHGIDVTERVGLVVPANTHNQEYLQTKADKAGHLL